MKTTNQLRALRRLPALLTYRPDSLRILKDLLQVLHYTE